MTPISIVTAAFERMPLSDGLARAGIALLVERTRRKLDRAESTAETAFAAEMGAYPIAEHADKANAQHYELPPEFFGLILGPRRKYSCCLYDGPGTLAAAEERALAETTAHAGLADGQRILELGCGWGSLSLWMAEHYPGARIVAVSNARSQRAFIEAEAARRGFRNLRIVTADMNQFAADAHFDRIVSVEMFEHMSNWTALLNRAGSWLEPDGRLFLHVFSRSMPYRFDSNDRSDWIAQHFFTGGVMPSHGLIRHLATPFEIEAEWRWSGTHYRRTAEDWLANFDSHAEAIGEILHGVYGSAATPLWRRRWRLFFLSTAGLFGADAGKAWGVSHYRLRPR